MDNIEEILTRGVANIIPGKEKLGELLKSKKKLNIYLGIDPTATKIHLGHGVPLRKLQAFAEMGHNIKFLIGDFTALIGDTSDKDTERPVLTSEQIEENFSEYKKQASKIINFDLPNVSVVHNSDWLKKLNFEEIVKLCQHFSFGDFASRELISKRLKNKKHVGLHEALYPVMQGYDSYFLDTDIQLGGTDQTFNMQAGRILQKDLRNKESFVLANEFLMGTDGKKMSKTGGNTIWIDDVPDSMFAKIMAIDDNLITQYALLGTKLPLSKIKEFEENLKNGKNPRDIKKELAFIIVSEFYNEKEAQNAKDNFEKTVQKKEIPNEMPIFNLPNSKSLIAIIDLLLEIQIATSRSEAKRLVEQGGVEIDGERITDANQDIKIEDEIILKIGKRNYNKIKLNK